MSVLVIGADEITPIRAVLQDLGAKKSCIGMQEMKTELIKSLSQTTHNA